MEDKNDNRELLVDKSLCYLAVHVDAAIAQEGPPAAHVLAVSKVNLHDHEPQNSMPGVCLLGSGSKPTRLTDTTGSPLATA